MNRSTREFAFESSILLQHVFDILCCLQELNSLPEDDIKDQKYVKKLLHIDLGQAVKRRNAPV